MKNFKSKFKWQTGKSLIECRVGQTVLFSDTLHHYNSAVLRLPHQTDQEAKNWLEESFKVAEQKSKQSNSFKSLPLDQKVSALKLGFEKVNLKAKVKQNTKFFQKAFVGACGHKANYIYANMVDQNEEYAVVGCTLCEYGWLVDAKKPQKSLKDTVDYEEEYFEGGTEGLGYGHYLQQESWRVEKAYGQIRQIKSAAEFLNISLGKNSRLLDIGSGYGFLRKAAQDAGWKHDGTDASNFAAKIAKKHYGFNTFVGFLDGFIKKNKGKQYDVIVLADVIEHVKNPIAELELVKTILKPGGLCMIRTPSIVSVEGQVFGNMFYSLKSEHLHYFSPRAISIFAQKAGLAPRLVLTQSHFFKGLLGEDIRLHEALGLGSDIFALLQNV